MIRTANIEVSLQRLSILRIEHPQANPLKLACTLRAGETLPSGLTVTAEIHTSRNVAAETAPLASTTVTVAADATAFDVSFTSEQLNQTVTPNSTRALWLVLYGVGAEDQIYTLSAADLLLGWHAISQLTADPPATSILIEKGGVAWASGRTYASGTMVTVGTTAYVATAGHTSGSTTQPGTGASWETVWTVLSGGDGATNLSRTLAPTTVTIVSSTGDDAVIPSADGTNAGVLTSAFWSKLNDLPPADSFGALAFLDTVGASQIDSGAVTEAKINDGAVTSAKIAATAVTTAKIADAAVTYVKMQAVGAASRILGRGTGGTTAVREISLGSGLSMSGDVLSATATGGGTNTIIQKFPEDATFPTTNFATRDTRNNHPVLDFADSGAEIAYFKAFIPQGASFAASGTALTFVIESTATSATTGNVGWGISLERIVANGIDIDSDAFGTELTGSAAVNAASGKYSETTINFTLAQLPSGLAAGDMIRICLKRNTAVGSNHSGDAEFHGLYANMTPLVA